jgi:hypothetical protein
MTASTEFLVMLAHVVKFNPVDKSLTEIGPDQTLEIVHVSWRVVL